MPSIPLHPPRASDGNNQLENPLPGLLQTPSGLAIVEIQGTIHTPSPSGSNGNTGDSASVGKLVFPYYSPSTPAEDTSWMKRVYLYVGKHQRLTGEVKKLVKPLAVVRKRAGDSQHDRESGNEELEVVEIIRQKIVFSHRPEPVGDE